MDLETDEQPYELLVRFAPDGSVKGISERSLIVTRRGGDEIAAAETPPTACTLERARAVFPEAQAVAALSAALVERDTLQAAFEQEADARKAMHLDLAAQADEIRTLKSVAAERLRRAKAAEAVRDGQAEKLNQLKRHVQSGFASRGEITALQKMRQPGAEALKSGADVLVKAGATLSETDAAALVNAIYVAIFSANEAAIGAQEAP